MQKREPLVLVMEEKNEKGERSEGKAGRKEGEVVTNDHIKTNGEEKGPQWDDSKEKGSRRN